MANRLDFFCNFYGVNLLSHGTSHVVIIIRISPLFLPVFSLNWVICWEILGGIYQRQIELHKIASIIVFFLIMMNNIYLILIIFTFGRHYIQKLRWRRLAMIVSPFDISRLLCIQLYKTVNTTVTCCSRTCNYRAFEREYMTLSAKIVFQRNTRIVEKHRHLNDFIQDRSTNEIL